MFDRTGFLAGTDDRRFDELSCALAARDVGAVVAARGGYGLTRIAHRLDLDPVHAHPKWIVGFSDITALHVEAMRAGIASIHGENIAGLGRGDDHGRAAWVQALETPCTPRVLRGTEAWRAGAADGVLFGGNLTLLFTCAAAGRLKLPAPCVLALEDVSEAAYRIDRMLSALLASGALASVSAVAVGDFDDCGPGRHGVPTRTVLEERLGALGVPILAGLPFGHGRHNAPLAFGQRAHIDTARGELVQCLA
jgi:muramoyltetrapeptide carboxypeptidase